MKDRFHKLLDGTTYKGFSLDKYRKFYGADDDIKKVIDQVLLAHPEYLEDAANMFRELSQGRGTGKSHLSGYHDGDLLTGAIKFSRRQREKHRKVKIT